jgi:crossover junction endodeoxyribonuclease RusA
MSRIRKEFDVVTMQPFEFLVQRRPLSHQASSKSKQVWKNFVQGCATQTWTGLPIADEPLRFALVYLCQQDPADINNIIKPVQDALIGPIYSDDDIIVDVHGHLRMVGELNDVTGLPTLLKDALLLGAECVYVRIDSSKQLNEQL